MEREAKSNFSSNEKRNLAGFPLEAIRTKSSLPNHTLLDCRIIELNLARLLNASKSESIEVAVRRLASTPLALIASL